MGHVASIRLSCLLATGILSTAIVTSAAQARQPARREVKQVTRASWYGNAFKGQRTASGRLFNPQHLTAAHPTLHLGSKVKVTDLRSGRSVVVQITDRGPFAPGRGIDLSYAAAQRLGIVRQGVARVRLELVERPTPASDVPIVTALNGPTMPWLPQAIVE